MASNYLQPLTVNKRVRYYDGQFLQDQDLVDEQKYHVARLDQHQRTLHTAGVIEGLTAYIPSNPNFRVGVRTGSALDIDGRLILLAPKTSTYELPANAANSDRWLYIAYHQEPSDLQSSGEGVEGETRWTEKPYIFTSEQQLGSDDTYQGPDWNGYLPANAGPPPPVLLARLTVDDQGNVTAVDNSVRTYSGVRLPGPGDDAPALRADPRGFVGLHMVHEGVHQERLTIKPSGNLLLRGNKSTVNAETEEFVRFLRPVDTGTKNSNSAGLNIGACEEGIGGKARLDVKLSGAPGSGNSWGREPDVTVMSLCGTGNVGIGTTAPLAKLDVAGDLSLTSGNRVFKGANWVSNYEGSASHFGAIDTGFYAATGGALQFVTAGADSVRFAANGSVGIGMDDPQTKLHVAGPLTVHDAVYAAPATGAYGGTGQRLVFWPGSTNEVPYGMGIAGSTMWSAVPSDAIHSWYTGTTERMRITADGNLGIGTTAPAAKLHVNGDDSTTSVETIEIMRLMRPGVSGVKNSNSAGLNVGACEDGMSGKARLDFVLSGAPGSGNAWGSVPDVTVLSLCGTGNVGIGTTSPDANLHVLGQAENADNGSLILGATNGSNLRLGYHGDYSWIQSHSGKPLALNPLDHNVGIGTTSPEAKLDVAGDLFLTAGNRVFKGANWVSNYEGSLSNFESLDTGFYAATGGALQLVTAGADSVRFAANGNVGIGTTSPSAKLDVVGSGARNVDMIVNGRMRSNNNEGGLWVASNRFFGGHTTNKVGIWTNEAGWALSANYNGNIGIGTTDPGYKLQVNGTTYITGDLWLDGWLKNMHGGHYRNLEREGWNSNAKWSSDIRLKQNVRPIENALTKINKLRGIIHEWNETGLNYFTQHIADSISAGPDATQEENERVQAAELEKAYQALAGNNIGLIAQEVETVVPEVVDVDEHGYKQIQYQHLTALLIEAVKEQSEIIQKLSNKVAFLVPA